MATHTNPADPLSRAHVTVIKGGQRGPSLAVFGEVVAYRGVLYALVQRSIATRYRQSVFGLVWILGGPLSSAGIYSVFLGGVAGLKGDRSTNYTLFVLVGTVIWGIFARGGIGGMTALMSNSAFVKKVYFPRVMLPLSQVGQSLADLVPALGMMFLVALIVGVHPRLSWILILLPILTVTIFSTAFCMATSAVNVYFRDLSYAAPLLTQAGLLASAVVYPLSKIPASFRTAYGILNPAAGQIDIARAVVYRGDGVNASLAIGGLLWSLVLLVLAFIVFSILERDAADRI